MRYKQIVKMLVIHSTCVMVTTRKRKKEQRKRKMLRIKDEKLRYAEKKNERNESRRLVKTSNC